MVAQSSANFPIFCGDARQRARGFGALAEDFGELQFPLLKIIKPSCKKNQNRFI